MPRVGVPTRRCIFGPSPSPRSIVVAAAAVEHILILVIIIVEPNASVQLHIVEQTN